MRKRGCGATGAQLPCKQSVESSNLSTSIVRVCCGGRSRVAQAAGCGPVYVGSSPTGYPFGRTLLEKERVYGERLSLYTVGTSGRAAGWRRPGSVKPPRKHVGSSPTAPIDTENIGV